MGETKFLVKDAYQSNRNISVVKKIFQPLLSEEWKLMTAVCAPKLEVKKKDVGRGCTNCTRFILGEEEILDMKTWIGRIVAEHKGNTSNNRPDPYVLMIDTICLSLINNMTRESGKANKLVIDLKDHSKETEDMLHRNVVKLELKDNPTIVVIDGDYGVGKTYWLQERAKCVSQEDPSCKLAYINLSSYNSKNMKAKTITDLVAKNMKAKTITDLVAEIMFEDYENIDVTSTINLHEICPEEENIYELIKRYFKVNGHYTHIYIDELPRPNKFALWHNIFQTGKQYCVTLKVNPSPFDNHEGKMWIL